MPATFSSLKHHNFRLFWLGTLISNSGDWMDQVALNWLVLQMTDSPFYLGLVNFARAVPILIFTLLGGAAADRVDRRRLMLMTQSSAMALALILAALVITDTASIGLVLLIATGRGLVVAFNLPARHSLIPGLVPRDHLANAVALNSLTLNVTKIIGPTLAGLIIAAYGTGACFLFNGVTFLVVLWTLWAMDIPPSTRPRVDVGIARSIVEGVRFVRDDRTILLLVLIATVPTFFGQPYLQLLALFAHDVFEIGPRGLGLLMSCAACGAVGGALLVASVPKRAATGAAMLGFLLAFGCILCAFALNPALWLAPVLLFGVGAMHIAYNASNNTILQLRLPDHVRGRVLSILLLNRGLVQLGTAALATLAGLFGARFAVAGGGLVIVCFATAILVLSRSMRRLTA